MEPASISFYFFVEIYVDRYALAFELKKVVFENLRFIVPGAIDTLELQIPFSSLYENFRCDGSANLSGENIDAVPGSFGLQQIVDSMQRRLQADC